MGEKAGGQLAASSRLISRTITRGSRGFQPGECVPTDPSLCKCYPFVSVYVTLDPLDFVILGD